jgi:hypothetical protein
VDVDGVGESRLSDGRDIVILLEERDGDGEEDIEFGCDIVIRKSSQFLILLFWIVD